MTTRTGWMQRRVLTLALVGFGVVAMTGTALAGHQTSGVKSYTGCLVSGDGVMIKIKEGNAPRSACSGGQVEAHFSGGDITKISVGAGLSLPNGGDNGEVRIELAAGQTLPQGCADGRVAEWDSGTSRWICGVDNDTTYAAGTGLDLDISETPDEFSIDPAHRLPGKACTTSGHFARGFDSNGAIQCAAPPAATSVGFFSRTAASVEVAGTMTILSETLPAGNYLVFAHVVGNTPSFDEPASGHCDVAGDRSALSLSDDPLERFNENMTLLSGIVHPGGPVALTCTEASGNFDVESASLAAIKLDSIG